MTGEELAQIRRAAGLSQAELAERAGISRQAVSYWERQSELAPHSRVLHHVAHVINLHRLWGRTRFAEFLEAEARALRARYDALVAVEEARLAKTGARRQVPCGALTRAATACRLMSEPGKLRCRLHGGRSTGPRTPEGRERIADAQRRRWAQWRDEHEAGS